MVKVALSKPAPSLTTAAELMEGQEERVRTCYVPRERRTTHTTSLPTNLRAIGENTPGRKHDLGCP